MLEIVAALSTEYCKSGDCNLVPYQIPISSFFMAAASGINDNNERLVFESSEAVSVVPTFDQLGLKEDLLRGIYAYSKPVLTRNRIRKDRRL
jgi:hypothetical protein